MLLSEGKFSGYIRGNGCVLAFAGRGKEAPAYVIYDQTSSGYDVIETKPVVLSKTALELFKLSRQDGSADSAYRELNYISSRLRLGWKKDDLDLSVIAKYPKIFRLLTIKDKKSLHQLMCVDNQMTDQMFVKYFGELEEDDHAEQVEDFKGLKFFFPTGMRESRKKDFHRVFEDLKGMYVKHGLGKVITGNVKFAPIVDNALGQYYITSKEIRVDPAGKDLLRLLYVMIHEYAHKYYYEFIPNKIPEITTKFKELGGLNRGKDRGHMSTSYEHKLGLNDILIYEGNNKQYLKFGKKWIISGIASKAELSSVAIPGVKLTAPEIESFLTMGWKPESVEVSISRVQISHNLSYHKNIKTSDWFPTAYSMTNPSEWFAELLTMYMLGALEGDVKKYVESLI